MSVYILQVMVIKGTDSSLCVIKSISAVPKLTIVLDQPKRESPDWKLRMNSFAGS